MNQVSMNTTTTNTNEQSLNKLAQDWAAAELRGDTAFLERTLADDFVGIGPRGFMLIKDDWLQRIKSGDLKYESLNWDEAKVRLYDKAAIVTGRAMQKVNYQGNVMEARLRTTLVFVNQQGWQLAGLQFSPIVEGP